MEVSYNKLVTLKKALEGRGLFIDAALLDGVIKRSFVAPAGSMVLSPAGVLTTVPAAAAVPPIAAPPAAAATGGFMGSIAGAGTACIASVWCAVAVVAIVAAASTGAYLYDSWNDNNNLIERFGGTESDSLAVLWTKWCAYLSNFDLVRGSGSFPKGATDEEKRSFFTDLAEKFNQGSRITESQFENMVEQHIDSMGWTTYGLDDEVYFVNSFNALIEIRNSIEAERREYEKAQAAAEEAEQKRIDEENLYENMMASGPGGDDDSVASNDSDQTLNYRVT